MLNKKKMVQTKTIMAPEGSFENRALMPAPAIPPAAPRPPEMMTMRHIFSVQNLAAAAGMTSKAIIRMSPTA